jgi:hypothetical protein
MSILNNQMFTTNTQNLELPPLSAEMLWGFLIYPTSASAVYETNLKNSVSRNITPIPQSIIVDTTSMAAGDITILWDKGDLNYSLVVPFGCKHVFSVPAIADCVYSVTFSAGAAGGDVRIDLVNFPLIPQSYSIVSATGGDIVSVTNFPATQPVSGTVSVGNFPATQAVDGAVSVDNFPATQPISGQVSLLQGTTDLSVTNPIFAQITNTDLVVAPSSASLVSGVVSASGSTTVGTPIANTNLRGLTVSLTGNASQATAGVLTVTLALDAVTVAVLSFFVPATAGNIISGIEHFRDFSDVSFPVGSAGTLTCELSAALATGVINVNGYFA